MFHPYMQKWHSKIFHLKFSCHPYKVPKMRSWANNFSAILASLFLANLPSLHVRLANAHRLGHIDHHHPHHHSVRQPTCVKRSRKLFVLWTKVSPFQESHHNHAVQVHHGHDEYLPPDPHLVTVHHSHHNEYLPPDHASRPPPPKPIRTVHHHPDEYLPPHQV